LATEDKFIACDSCKKGRVISSLKELKLQQWRKKGYVHFRVMLTVRVCDFCGAKSFEPGPSRFWMKPFNENATSCRKQ
jgi:hypothetical protein